MSLIKITRKIESLNELWARGFHIGTIKEFMYNDKRKMFQYAQFLVDTFDGFSVRTDNPPGSKTLPINLPILKNTDLEKLKGFVEKYKSEKTYILYQKRHYDDVIWQGCLWLDECRVLHGEINRKDKGLNNREAMSRTESLEHIMYGNGRYKGGFGPIRYQMIKSRIEPHDVVDASSYLENGQEAIYYKKLRRYY